MSREQILPLFNQNTPPSPLGALPVVTFEDDMTFHVDGETIRVIHVANAHTDGDAIVIFENANVIHLGDTFWNGFYPRIDAGAGGSVQGVIAAIEAALEQGDAQSQYIPGHGPLPERGPDAVRAYLEMLYAVRGAVQELVDQGLSEDAVVAARPTRSFDEQWGEGGMSPEVFSRIVYRSLVQ